MIEPNLNATPKQVRQFGLILIVFAAALGGLTLWRGDALIAAAIFLGGAWFVSLIFNRENRLRQLLGVILPALCAAIGLPIRYGVNAMTVATVVWIIGGAIGLGAIFAPPFSRVIYTGWMLAAVPIGWTVSHLAMAGVYYLVFTPIGLVMRLVGYDPMRRRIDRDAESYWLDHEQPADTRRYFQQF